jgi:anti-sigma factor RsiW
VSEMRAARMSCRELVDLLSDHLDEALPAATRERVEAHLATCPDCSAYVAQLRTTIGLLGRLREEDVPEPVFGELVRTFRGWRSD